MSGIPVLHVESDCIARGWEESLIELNRKGCRIIKFAQGLSASELQVLV